MSRWIKRAILVFSFILTVLLMTGMATAGGSIDRGEQEEFCSDDLLRAGPGAFAGKPVSLLSGSETYTRTDLTLGNLYPISIQRRYNSRSGYDSQLGYGWALNHDRRIYTYPDGSVTLRKECGWKRRFTLSNGTYVTPLGEAGTLVKNADGTFTYTKKDGSKEVYDLQGRLATLVDTKGNSLTITYQDDIRLPLWGLLFSNTGTNPLIVSYDYRIVKIEEKDAAGSLTGNWVSFQYDFSTGRLNNIWDSLGRIVTYGHDGFGNLTSVSGPGVNAVYTYGDPGNAHRMTGIDEGQGQYTNVYDAKGRIIQQIHGTGVIDIEYLEASTKTRATTTIKDASGTVLNTQVRTVEFDSNGQIAKETDTFGTVNIYTRDSNMRLTREEHWENTGTVDSPNLVLKTATNYTYDSKGNMLTKTEAQGTALEKTTTYTYHSTLNKVLTETVKSVVNTAQNKVITNTYDTAGNLLTTTEAGLLGSGASYSYTTTYTYDSNGRVKTIDGPRTDVSDVTTYYYDPITGYLTSLTQPIIDTTSYSNHDALGNPRTITDPNGNATTYTYDTIGRVLTVKAPGDTAATQYVYVSVGCTSCGSGGANKIDYIILPEGNKIDYDYDSYGNLAKISDNAGNSINYTYDSEGNRLKVEIRDTAGLLQKSLDYQYDALNRVKQIRNPDNTYTEYAYDFGGKRTSLTDPKGNTTAYSYDALNRLTDMVQPGTITTKYGYDTNNNVTSIKDANTNTTTYKYDDKGRIYQVISPDTGTTTYGYDAAGNLTSKTDAKGTTVAYSYDALNRLTKIDFSSDTDIVYTYDTCFNGKGRLCTMTDTSGTTSYEYTPKGQVKKETKVIDSVNYVTQYTYDQNGNLKTMTYPSGRVITYNYTNDRAVSVLNNAANLTTNISYKPFGGMSSLTYGNGLTGTIGYDNQYRITSITAGTVLSLSYNQYDANGNIKNIQNILDPTKNRSYDYDSLNRLGTATGPWGSIGWTYDGAGNRQTQTNGSSSSYSYQTGTNKLTSITGAVSMSFTFDSNGNTYTENAKEFIYNQNQRLIRVTDGGVTKGEYTFNGNGQRVKKVVNGTTTIFHYSLSGQLIVESNSAGATTSEYVYLNSQPLAKIEGTLVYYYHNDHLATPQKMTDSTGTVVWSADYKPFGEATITTNTITNNLRFPGQYYDAETGLHYNYFRDYDPVVGRYIESDPIGIAGGKNHLFAYVGNNPESRTDPFGLWCRDCQAEYEACERMADSHLQYTLQSVRAMINWMREQAQGAYTHYQGRCQGIQISSLRNACYLAAWAHYQSATALIDSLEITDTLMAYGFYTGEMLGCQINKSLCDSENAKNPCCR